MTIDFDFSRLDEPVEELPSLLLFILVHVFRLFENEIELTVLVADHRARLQNLPVLFEALVGEVQIKCPLQVLPDT